MTFKKVHFQTLGLPSETWGIDYRKAKVITPGGIMLPITWLIDWYRYQRGVSKLYAQRLDRIKELVGEKNWAYIEKDWNEKRGRKALDNR